MYMWLGRSFFIMLAHFANVWEWEMRSTKIPDGLMGSWSGYGVYGTMVRGDFTDESNAHISWMTAGLKRLWASRVTDFLGPAMRFS